LATLLKTGIDSVGKMELMLISLASALTPRQGKEQVLFEARYAHHHRRTEDDAADNLSDDPWLVQPSERV
jgi:hypothetical protein